MKRLIDVKLLEWKKSSSRKSLLLRGARQVGKTYAVRNLGKTFEQFVEVNLEKRLIELSPLFEGNLDPKEIILKLSIIVGKPIIPGKTLLFLDEIQAIPRAITALRYFYEEMPELHVIGAGSLLDFAIMEIGVPVGRVTFLHMYPLSFIEFLCAIEKTLLIEKIFSHTVTEPMGDILHNHLLSLLGEYFAVGGMPEAVNFWANDQKLKSFEVHNEIISAYKQDFHKYSKKSQIKYVEKLFSNIPVQIGKKFKFSEVGEFRKRELLPALELLQTALVINEIKRTDASGIPLGAGVYLDDFKAILLDIAINQVILGEKKHESPLQSLGSWTLRKPEEFANKGSMVEAFIGQEILAYSNPTRVENLYYWRKDAQGSEAEIDYVTQCNEHIIPIEVKSGKGSTLKSMLSFLETHHNTPFGIRFSTNEYSVFEKIHSYPLYAVAPLFLYDKKIIETLL